MKTIKFDEYKKEKIQYEKYKNAKISAENASLCHILTTNSSSLRVKIAWHAPKETDFHARKLSQA